MTEKTFLENISLKAKNFKCFGNEYVGFERFTPINIIIGRNNSGKSSIVDIIELAISANKYFDVSRHSRVGGEFSLQIGQRIDRDTIASIFQKGTSGGHVRVSQDHYDYAQQYIGMPVTRSFATNGEPKLEPIIEFNYMSDSGIEFYNASVAKRLPSPFSDKALIRVAVERNVQPEHNEKNIKIDSNGSGITNLIRHYLHSQNTPRDEIEIELLNDLNTVYKGDAIFKRISCREDVKTNLWEVFLMEDVKGEIRLSESGSSLKSIFIILCTLRFGGEISKWQWNKAILFVEEPENNLHPALLRRLLDFLSEEQHKKKFILIMATHSSLAIDWGVQRTDSQLIHIVHKDGSAISQPVMNYRASVDILDDLDARASDILQSNGIIWVEGPSDRIYLNKWIELHSNGQLQEGRHYRVLFYGGKLLSHLHGNAPGEFDALVSVFAINRNAALLIDSDRRLGGGKTKTNKTRKPRQQINETKRRVRDEVENNGGFVWITIGREVENYISNDVISRFLGKDVPIIGPYDSVVEHQVLNEYRGNKVDIASKIVDHLVLEDLQHMDLLTKISELCEVIRRWNRQPMRLSPQGPVGD